MRVKILNNFGMAMKNVVIGIGLTGVAAAGVGIAVNFMGSESGSRDIRTQGPQVVYNNTLQQQGTGTYAPRQGTGLTGGNLTASQKAAAQSGEDIILTAGSGAVGGRAQGSSGGSARSELQSSYQESETGPDTGAKKLVSGFGAGADLEAQQRMLNAMNDEMRASAGGSGGGGGTQVQADALANAFGSNNTIGNMSGNTGGRGTSGGQTWNPAANANNIQNIRTEGLPPDVANMLKDTQDQIKGLQQRGRVVGMSEGTQESGGAVRKLGSQRVSDSTGQAYALRQAMASAKDSQGAASTVLSDIYQGGQNQSGSAPRAPTSSNDNDYTPTWEDIKKGNIDSGGTDTDNLFDKEEMIGQMRKARDKQALDLALGILLLSATVGIMVATLLNIADAGGPYAQLARVGAIALTALFAGVSVWASIKIMKNYGDGANVTTGRRWLAMSLITAGNGVVGAAWIPGVRQLVDKVQNWMNSKGTTGADGELVYHSAGSLGLRKMAGYAGKAAGGALGGMGINRLWNNLTRDAGKEAADAYKQGHPEKKK